MFLLRSVFLWLALPQLILAEQIVTNLDDSGPGSLHAAITEAASVDTITFDPALSGSTLPLNTTNLRSALVEGKELTFDALALPDSITFNGERSGRLIVPDNIELAFLGINFSKFAFEVDGTLLLNQCQLTEANFDAPSNGRGAIEVNGVLEAESCIFKDNAAQIRSGQPQRGGAITGNSGSSITLRQSAFVSNTNQGNGGAIHVRDNSTLTVENSTFTGNSCGGTGGAIYSESDISLNHVTITANTANGIGGVFVQPGTHNVISSIIAGNSGVQPSDISIEAMASAESNWLSGNPQLAPIGGYGGFTPTRPPLILSPTIAGLPGPTLTTDQRGAIRPPDSPADFGAAQIGLIPDREPILVSNPVVRRADDIILTPLDPLNLSLREAIAFAGSDSLITFAPGFDATRTFVPPLQTGAFLYLRQTTNLPPQTAMLADGPITVSTNLTIDGANTAGHATIDGRWDSAILEVNPGVNLTLRNLNIIRGGGGRNAAIRNEGNLQIDHCSFIENFSFSRHAAIWSGESTSLTITNTEFFGNSCDSSSISDEESIIRSLGDLQLSSSSFNSNLFGYVVASDGTTQIDQITVANNRQGVEGASGELTINFSTFAGNESAGLTIDEATTTLNSSAFSGNTDPVSEAFLVALPGDRLSVVDPDLQLSPIGFYGGFTTSMPPLSGSPTIDNGGSTTLTIDQRGGARTIGAAADLGATERGALLSSEISPTENPIVTITQDRLNIAEATETQSLSIREAIAIATPGSTITFAPDLAGLSFDHDFQDLAITREVTLSGIGLASLPRLSHSFKINTPSPVIFEDILRENGESYFIESDGPETAITLNRVTVVDSERVINLAGGMTISDCLFENNESAEFFNRSLIRVLGDLEITSSIFRTNTRPRRPMIIAEGDFTMMNSTLTENDCDGILEVTSNNITIDSCAISKNNSLFQGVVQLTGSSSESSITLSNSSFSENATSSGDSGIELRGEGLFTISRCTINNNGTSDRNDLSGITFLASGQCLIERSTITNNRGRSVVYTESTSGSLSLNHVTITGNLLQSATIENRVSVSIQNSIVSGNGRSSTGQLSSSSLFDDLGGNFFDDSPDLFPLDDYGGQTFTMPPTRLSPVRNLAGQSTSRIDQRDFRIPDGELADAGSANYAVSTSQPSDNLSLTLDDDGDGMSNGFEFAIGRDPLSADDANENNLQFTADGSLRFGYNFVATSDIILRISSSNDLENFDNIIFSNDETSFSSAAGFVTFQPPTETTHFDPITFQTVTVQDPGPTFYRLEAVRRE